MKSLLKILRTPSPVIKIEEAIFDEKDIELYVKRDDLIHPLICGNKWRKLKANLSSARSSGATTIASYGGSFSNHLVALALCANKLGLNSIGYIRSWKESPDNPTIRILRNMGMRLFFLKPDDYIDHIRAHRHYGTDILKGEVAFIPEGGTNEIAMSSIAEAWSELDTDLQSVLTHSVMAIGTGGFLAGISRVVPEGHCLIGVSAFRKVPRLLAGHEWISPDAKVEIWPSACSLRFAGYSKPLVDFINNFWYRHKIMLDPIYTGRALMTLYVAIERHKIKSGSKILFWHTGGIQGILGYNKMHGAKGPIQVPHAFLIDLAKPATTLG